ncbi:MAG: exodeoxyribonuclease III [Alphaproteobacteria bacterium]|nr:exodeoxyribonuclease III [Alphaproteobacteria bacterium]
MKIASWNVNSIKARGDHVLRYLRESESDILMVQELKGLEFPKESIEAAGYHSHIVAQKAYNGVAIMSKTPFDVVQEALEGDASDEQARYLEIKIDDVHYINIYLPNGNPAPGTKYEYKLGWMKRLKHRVSALVESHTPFIIGGDFNVIPEGKDCHDPKTWKDDALFHIQTRKAFRSLLNLGLTDAFRVFNTGDKNYTFWDYQAGAWQKNNGIRIDHFLLSPLMADKLENCVINKEPRGWDKPSDHTPIELTLKLTP